MTTSKPTLNKGNNKITELRTILQSDLKSLKKVHPDKTVDSQILKLMN